jgi:hypothetical protein
LALRRTARPGWRLHPLLSGFVLAILLLSTYALRADALDNWHVRSPHPNFWGVAFANGTFVAVDDHSEIITSPNAVEWTLRRRGDIGPSYSVAYGNSRFVTVGEGGVVFTSPDGVLWTFQISGVSLGLYSITFANGLFVAVGESGIILTSVDGAAWKKQTLGTTEALYTVSYGQ